MKPSKMPVVSLLVQGGAMDQSASCKGPGFSGSPNTCAAACTRKASASLEINYQSLFNELLASRINSDPHAVGFASLPLPTSRIW